MEGNLKKNCSQVDGPRVRYTEWSKSERENQISNSNAYMYVESRKWFGWTYLQGRNRDANVENRPVDIVGEGEGGMSRDQHNIVKQLNPNKNFKQ